LLLARHTAWSSRNATEHRRHPATPAQPLLPPHPTTYDVTNLPTRLDPSRARRAPERVLLADDPSEDLVVDLLRPLQMEEVTSTFHDGHAGPLAEVPFGATNQLYADAAVGAGCRYSVGCWACCQAARPSVRNSAGME
jgi:hypothetical protein